jgi:hypothetical protein
MRTPKQLSVKWRRNGNFVIGKVIEPEAAVRLIAVGAVLAGVKHSCDVSHIYR